MTGRSKHSKHFRSLAEFLVISLDILPPDVLNIPRINLIRSTKMKKTYMYKKKKKVPGYIQLEFGLFFF
jgi:hypothetical protein